ncbi:MAG: hypothetical protein N3D11_02335 [Candidatus Sumerlaeia bacterium]|nr:hypothetical protein [Candidatus Sumerlaeia bacterium]
MPEGMRGVICSLSDCLYYVRQGSRALCKHPEVHTNPAGSSCPFYKMDWQRKAAELAKRFKKTP